MMTTAGMSIHHFTPTSFTTTAMTTYTSPAKASDNESEIAAEGDTAHEAAAMSRGRRRRSRERGWFANRRCDRADARAEQSGGSRHIRIGNWAFMAAGTAMVAAESPRLCKRR
ncbi:MAG: hypothetical protein ACLRSW_14630 [Christensenellaceae bacterium]